MTPNADLATLRGTVSAYQDVISLPDVDRHMDAADRVEAELARLREGLRPESLARFWWWWLVLGFMLGTLFGYGLAVAS